MVILHLNRALMLLQKEIPKLYDVMNKQISILFADDDADDRELFCKALYEFDSEIKCETVEDGYETLEYLRNPANNLPDYIFLDFRMPRMSGKQCLEEIRKDEKLKEIPVII